jgi:hypothetical protein
MSNDLLNLLIYEYASTTMELVWQHLKNGGLYSLSLNVFLKSYCEMQVRWKLIKVRKGNKTKIFGVIIYAQQKSKCHLKVSQL